MLAIKIKFTLYVLKKMLEIKIDVQFGKENNMEQRPGQFKMQFE